MSMERTIWYVEDDERIAEYVAEFLGEHGFRVRAFRDGLSVRNALAREAPDALLVDWNLPDDTAPSICKWIRHRNAELPIIVVTVRDDPADVVNGLQSGADDYVTKPFVAEVLLSRLEALLRRASPSSTVFSCGNLRVDDGSHRAFAGEEALELTPLEYRLLVLFMRNKGRIVSRRVIRGSIWEMGEGEIGDNTLTVAIKRLRAKLGPENHLVTVRSFGYRLEEPQ